MKQLPLVVLRIREMILQGHLAPGQRVAEAMIANHLGISRTPVRQALPALAQEGLLVAAGPRGYAVRAFTAREILQAIDLRGVLEGMAGRIIAERGAPRGLLRVLHGCLEDGDALFAKGHLVENDASAYAEMNARLHQAIIEGAENRLLADSIARIHLVPFASPSAFAFRQTGPEQAFGELGYAHHQHHAIVEALEHGQGARAEALLREHVNPVKQSISLTDAEMPAENALPAR